MRVKLTFSTEADQVYDELNRQLKIAMNKIEPCHDLLAVCSTLFEHDDKSGQYILSMVEQVRERLAFCDATLNDLNHILAAYERGVHLNENSASDTTEVVNPPNSSVPNE